MTVSISKPNWRGLQALGARAASVRRRIPTPSSTTVRPARAAASSTAEVRSTATARPRWRGEVDSAWVLTAMVGALCLVALGWFFAHGAAATFWLVALITIGFAGVPLGLLTLRLLRYDDND